MCDREGRFLINQRLIDGGVARTLAQVQFGDCWTGEPQSWVFCPAGLFACKWVQLANLTCKYKVKHGNEVFTLPVFVQMTFKDYFC